jgi:hypothetical protein
LVIKSSIYFANHNLYCTYILSKHCTLLTGRKTVWRYMEEFWMKLENREDVLVELLEKTKAENAQLQEDVQLREAADWSKPQVGSLVDVTASLEIEQEEMTRVNPSQALTADFWTLKLLLGAIDASWDEADEKPGQRQGGVPPPSQGSAYPQQGGPEGSYGRGYNQGYALPGAGIYGQPGGYGQPQQQLAYGQPPAGYQGGGGGYQGGAPQTYPVGPPARGQGWAGAGAPYGSADHGKLK